MSTWFSTAWSALQGFSKGTIFYRVHTEIDVLERGANPNMMFRNLNMGCLLVMIGAEWLKFLDLAGAPFAIANFTILWSLFLPTLINIWPRQGAQNSTLNHFIQRTNQILADCTNRHLGHHILAALNACARAIPTIKSPYIIKALNYIDKHILKIAMLIGLASFSTFAFVGQSMVASFALGAMGLGALNQLNVLPLWMRNTLKYASLAVAIPVGLNGSWVECLAAVQIGVSLTNILFRNVRIKPAITWLLSKFSLTRAFAKRMNDIDKKPTPFRFSSRINNNDTFSLFHTMRMHLYARQASVVKSHVLHRNACMPEKIQNLDLARAKTILASIDFDQHENVLKKYFETDWRTLRHQADLGEHEYDKDRAIQICKDNLQRFIERLQSDDFQQVILGAENLIKRYSFATLKKIYELQDSLPTLTEAEQAQVKTQIADAMIKLSFETSDYCPNGVLRCVESIYRSLTQSTENTPMASKIALLLQVRREQAFHGYFLRIAQRYPSFFLDVNDTHDFEFLASWFASRMGLPGMQLFEITDSEDLVEDFWHALDPSGLIQRFWRDNTPYKLETIICEAFGTPELPTSCVDEWFRNFVQNNFEGTEEEKMDFVVDPDNLPYTVEFIPGCQPKYTLKPGMARLMLLDCGVLELQGDTRSATNEVNLSQRLLPRYTPAHQRQQAEANNAANSATAHFFNQFRF